MFQKQGTLNHLGATSLAGASVGQAGASSDSQKPWAPGQGAWIHLIQKGEKPLEQVAQQLLVLVGSSMLIFQDGVI